jgi:hypothetical protein
MTKIKRYLIEHAFDDYYTVTQAEQGDWVRWEDVQELLKPRRMTFEEIAEAIRLVQEPLLAEEPNDPPPPA